MITETKKTCKLLKKMKINKIENNQKLITIELGTLKILKCLKTCTCLKNYFSIIFPLNNNQGNCKQNLNCKILQLNLNKSQQELIVNIYQPSLDRFNNFFSVNFEVIYYKLSFRFYIHFLNNLKKIALLNPINLDDYINDKKKYIEIIIKTYTESDILTIIFKNKDKKTRLAILNKFKKAYTEKNNPINMFIQIHYESLKILRCRNLPIYTVIIPNLSQYKFTLFESPNLLLHKFKNDFDKGFFND